MFFLYGSAHSGTLGGVSIPAHAVALERAVHQMPLETEWYSNFVSLKYNIK
jgi:hypothetical protein